MKYVVVSGGVVSGLGKGITASSVGRLLKECGLTVTAIKIDPYLNIDAGTMSPYEHGEVFVLDDGGEVDLDLGNYERFMDITLTRDHNITTGKIYKSVLDRERQGEYLGKTVQMVPHITNEIQNWISRVSKISVDKSNKTPDVCVIELGGTVGDIESMIFLEALRQFKFKVGPENFCLLHVSLITVVGVVGEQKTKPTQHSVTALRSAGLLPNMIICRSTKPVKKHTRQKISMFSLVDIHNVISVHDVDNIYQVPGLLLSQNVCNVVLKTLNINNIKQPKSINKFDDISKKLVEIRKNNKIFKIGIVGKYTGLFDSYISLIKAVKCAALYLSIKIEIVWIESSHLEAVKSLDKSDEIIMVSPKNKKIKSKINNTKNETSEDELIESKEDDDDEFENIQTSDSDESSLNSPKKDTHLLAIENHKSAWSKLCDVDGILVPGGFGDRGVEGKIKAIKYARENLIPFFGICLGFQMAVIEYARNVCEIQNAHSGEFDQETKHNVVMFMPEINQSKMGGTMRLGSRECFISSKNSIAYKLYNSQIIFERHRHRYEVNPKYIKKFEKRGLIFSGKDKFEQRMEIIELESNKHPYFFGCQFHPEFKSGPTRPSPPFIGFVKSCAGIKI